jgi:hypothetical protein
MILYHGGTLAVNNPRIITTEYGRDFGCGFYTTDVKDQAVRWARRKARIARRQKNGATGIVSLYEFDASAYNVLKVIHFPEPTLDWLDMVCKCRSDIHYSHGYDIVTGKIANDTVGQTVSYVIQGIMRKEDALERLQFEQINNQICFCTEKSLEFLKYTGFQEV